MANITGLKGYNRVASSVNKLLAGFGNDIVDVGVGTGFGLNLTPGDIEFEAFLDSIFYQNNTESPKSYNGTAWTRKHCNKMMLSKFIKRFKSRMYCGNCKFDGSTAPLDSDGNAIIFNSRVFHSDFFQNFELTWGLEYGRNGSTIQGTDIFQLDQSVAAINQDFIATNIKVGDPLFITNGNGQLVNKIYLVSKVESAYRLRVTDLNNFTASFPVSATSLHFWVGSNWFDVETNDNDQIMGFGETSDRLIIPKLNSIHFNSGPGGQTRQIMRSKGTSYGRSIVNDDNGIMYYFHGSQLKKTGIYMCDGVSAKKISRAIDPYIQGMDPANYSAVVGWVEGNELRWYLGNISNPNQGISITNAVATLNVDTGSWDVSPIVDVITAATTWSVNNVVNSYCGTNDNQVMKMNSGFNFNGAPIPWSFDDKPRYPAGSEIVNTFPFVQVIGRSLVGVKVRYKLWDQPYNIDDQWGSLGECTTDKNEFTIPVNHQQSSGIQLRFEEDGVLENDTYLEKVSIFYKPDRTRLR